MNKTYILQKDFEIPDFFIPKGTESYYAEKENKYYFCNKERQKCWSENEMIKFPEWFKLKEDIELSKAKYKFTEEDLRKCYDYAYWIGVRETQNLLLSQMGKSTYEVEYKTFEDFINSLSK